MARLTLIERRKKARERLKEIETEAAIATAETREKIESLDKQLATRIAWIAIKTGLVKHDMTDRQITEICRKLNRQIKDELKAARKRS